MSSHAHARIPHRLTRPAALFWFFVLTALYGSILNLRSQGKPDTTKLFTLENNLVKLSVVFSSGRLVGDMLQSQPALFGDRGPRERVIQQTDGGFALDVMYTDWQAPGRINNAENPIMLTKNDFVLTGSEKLEDSDHSQDLLLHFKAKETSLDLLMTYHLNRDEFFVRRSIAVMDTAFGHHFLRWIWARSSGVGGVKSVVKSGGFGQPVALLLEHGGAFFGLEYPTSENSFEMKSSHEGDLRCGQEFGQIIGGEWIRSSWVVEGITPDENVRLWFFRYIDAIRVAPLRPFTLYNSWYDLRSPEYPRVTPDHWMSEKSAIGMAKLLREKMIEKHDIRLDAFVLDDGWDVYQSDWLPRKEQWPNGFKPLADELKKTNTALGIWVGPTGGYSFRMKRVDWMKDHGYEVVGKSRDNAMLCLAGTNYSALFKKRVTDFVEKDGMGYFKWDGIQFSCSEPGHGHPVDIYSRRAVMESVIDKCRAVRGKNPGVFLNITSGTWLSPWWVQYANTIWMQGADYGFSDVPSISKRDGAITYRDFILYDDFKNQDFWFPIQNLMTHGIIKGKLESTGSPDEPLDKFTDDALLYCARGVSMYELYISPDILTDGEWNSLSASLTWARNRFPILSNTTMVGGDPMKREPYGYVHFKGGQGIVAARNPFITPGKLEVDLSVANGLDPEASNLAVKKVYPYHWASPRLYRAGEKITIPLDGYETAIYEIGSLGQLSLPVPAGVSYDVLKQDGDTYSVRLYNASPDARILNPEVIGSVTSPTAKGSYPRVPSLRTESTPPVLTEASVRRHGESGSAIDVKFTLSPTSHDAMLSVLLTPDSTISPKKKPSLSVFIDGKEAAVRTEEQEGRSQWYQVPVLPGRHAMRIEAKPDKAETKWDGEASVWLLAQQRQTSNDITFVLLDSTAGRQMMPHPWNPGEIRKSVKLGDARLVAGR